ncbi:hypothetical protein PVAP13_3KG472402 [Panicum virgatum]|uniref:DUF8039 domain-containing protein n=1 Tax=Panicum virgatum TaxID=38727 RepID=A0A8T0V9J2_PANVG|nr:hypothetical protein PVAP13_3KG472402 [Panicum virgatum]
MGRFSRFKSRRGKQAEAENNAENDDGGARSNSEGGGDGSPSEYLNLNQNDEAPAQTEEETTISAASRAKRGRNKMPKGRSLITELDELGEPVAPVKVMGPYKSAIGVVVKENVPITYRYWNAKDKTWVVPDSIKEICWGKLKEKFIFPEDSEPLARRRALFLMGNSFRYFKFTLNKHVKNETEPDWKDFPNQRPFWEQFVLYKRKNDKPYKTGSRGYIRKIPEWEEQAERLVHSGVTLQTDGWDPWAVRYLLARGAYYNPDGSLGFHDRDAEDLGRKIHEAHEAASTGAFVPDRENDELTRALGSKEHPGCTRGTGNVPWRFAFPEHLGTYRSRGRRNAQQQAEWQSLLQAVREEVNATNEKFRAELVESLSRGAPLAPGEAMRDAAPDLTSPQGLVRSSCGSTALPEEDIGVTFPVDKITQPTTCKLYIHQKFFDMKVAVGQAWPTGEGVMLHNRPLPEGYAKVTVDSLVKRKYKNVELDIPGDDKSESSDDDPRESPERDLPPSPKSNRESSPPSPQRELTPPSPPKKRRTSSRTQKISSQKQYSEPAEKPEGPCEGTGKKQVSGSITMLLEEKGKKVEEDFIVPKGAMDHFLNLMKLPQTGNNQPPLSNYERTMNIERWREGTRAAHKLNVAERATFCEQNNITELELLQIEYGEDWWKQPPPLPPITWKFELGKDLVALEQIPKLPTRMRYKLFGASYLDEDLHKGEGRVWVDFEHLYHFYQQVALDVSIMTLWTVMESHKCRRCGINNIGFLDPSTVHENTVNLPSTVDYLYKDFLSMQDKRSILLSYNCFYHHVLLDIGLSDSRIKYRKKNKIHRPFWGDFTVEEAKYILKQPPGNDHCGFYVMHYMHCYTGDCRSAEMNIELDSGELLMGELVALQEELAGWLVDYVVKPGSEYSII